MPWFAITWVDDGQMALDFRLRIFAVDSGGNQSAPFHIRVRDGDQPEKGCGISAAAGGRTAWSGLLLLARASFLRRRRA